MAFNLHSRLTVFWVFAPLIFAASSWNTTADVAQQSTLCGDGNYCDFSVGMTSAGEGTVSDSSMGANIESTSRRLTVEPYAGKPVSGSLISSAGRLDANFGYPTSLAVDEHMQNLYISDSLNQEVNGVNRSGLTSRVLSGPILNVTIGDVNTSIFLGHIGSIMHFQGHLYIADLDNGRILRMKSSDPSVIAVIANSPGMTGMTGDCGPATLAKFRRPRGMTVIPDSWDVAQTRSTLVVADSGNNRIRGFEVTDWPECMTVPNQGCGNSLQSSFINRTNGQLVHACSSATDCSFETGTPDECAFECYHLRAGIYPLVQPYVDLSFTHDDAVRLIGSHLNLNTNSTGFTSFEVTNKNFADINGTSTMQLGDIFLGMVVKNSLQKLSKTNLTNVQGLTPATGLTSATIWTFRFSVKPPECVRWTWLRTLSYGSQAVKQGLCFLSPLSPPHKIPCHSPNLGAVQGSRTCRPGRMRTLVGTGAPGSRGLQPSPGGITTGSSTHLNSPRGVLFYPQRTGQVWNSDFQFTPKLVVADTLHSRVLFMDLANKVNKVVLFWFFLSGRDAYKLVQNSSFTSIVSETFADALSLGAQLVVPTNFARPRPRAVARTPESCDPMDQGSQSWASSIKKRLSNQHAKMCEILFCAGYSELNFESLECCQQACKSCLGSCVSQLGDVSAARYSVEICASYKSYKNCVQGSQACEISSATCAHNVSRSSWQERMSGGWVPRISTQLKQTCPDGTVANAIDAACPICDKKMFEVLGLDPGYPSYLGLTSSTQIYGVRFALQAQGHQSTAHIVDNLVRIKDQELAAVKQGQYPRARAQVGAQLLQLHERFNKSMETRLNSISDVTFAISGTVLSDVNEASAYSGSYDVLYGTLEELAHPTSQVHQPTSLARDTASRIYIADAGTHSVMVATNQSHASVVVGTGAATFNGNGLAGPLTSLNFPTDVAVGVLNNDHYLLIADSRNHHVRSVIVSKPTTHTAWQQQLVEADKKMISPSAEDTRIMNSAIGCRQADLRSEVLDTIKLCLDCHSGNCNSSKFHVLCANQAGSGSSAAATLRQHLEDLGVNYTQKAGFECSLDSNQSSQADTSYTTEVLSTVFVEQYLEALQNLNQSMHRPSNILLSLSHPKDGTSTQMTIPSAFSMLKSLAGTAQELFASQIVQELCGGAHKSFVLRERLLLFNWFSVAASLPSNISAEVHFGQLHFNPMSWVPQLLLSPEWNIPEHSLVPSACHPSCGLLQPALFQSIQSGINLASCCGVGGYKCALHEGPCFSDLDCDGALVCGTHNCLWNNSNCCAQPTQGSIWAAYAEASRSAAYALGSPIPQ